MLIFLLGVLACACVADSVHYESFSGKVISDEVYKDYVKTNRTFWCLNDIKPCDPKEGRRLDGSCNNLKHPSRGAARTPALRLLPPVYDGVREPRKAKSGAPLMIPRRIRTGLLTTGNVPDTEFTTSLMSFLLFCSSDVLSVHDTVNYVLWKPYCCQEKGKSDPECLQIAVPDDDPVHRFSSIRCMNLTRPQSMQLHGCLPKDTTPERVVSATTLLDLSHVYGSDEAVLKKARLLEKGMLKTEVVDGVIWPPSAKTSVHLCSQNQLPMETRCHDTPEQGGNTVLGVNLHMMWTWRYHNLIAKRLSELNPCWNDEKLFTNAKEIVIASILNIFYYEASPALMGRENLIRDGIITEINNAFRDIYDENVLPLVTMEYPFVLRHCHTLQEGRLKMYDPKGHFVKEFPLVNLTLRTGWLTVDKNLEQATQSIFRQASARFDHTVDTDIAETILGPQQLASDVFTSDLTKNRHFGFQGYIEYMKHCSGKTIETFDDLSDYIAPERIELLKDKYEHPSDIDLLAGIWMEDHIPGGSIGPTFYCLVADQLKRSIVSDRHYYERQHRPHAFTLAQLNEIRKLTIAGLMCEVADKVTEIQPNAFYLAKLGNEMVSCSKIPKTSMEPWKDKSCKK